MTNPRRLVSATSVIAAIIVALGVATVSCNRNTATTSLAADAGADAPPVETPLAVLAKNKARLQAIDAGQVFRWTPSYQMKRRILEQNVVPSTADVGMSCDSPVLDWCPAVFALNSAPAKDEFESKKNKDAARKACEGCIEKIRAEVGAVPPLAIIEVVLIQEHDYSFEQHRYLLEPRDHLEGFFGGAPVANDRYAFAASAYDAERCGQGHEGVLFVRDLDQGRVSSDRRTYANPPAGNGHLVVALNVAEEEAKKLRPRLDADTAAYEPFKNVDAKAKPKTTDLLRVQILFEPEGYKATGMSCSLKAYGTDVGGVSVVGFVGRAIGTRVVDGKGVVADWEPVGPSP
jgi:copper chaperone CopZ